MPDPLSKAIDRWAAGADISAPSVLVTVFGDTVLPVAESLWLSQLFRMAEAFGYSPRLVRTAIYRLTADGWLTNERIGRQSRYHLTELAIRESHQAAQRIYHVDQPDWSGTWTMVLLDGGSISTEQRATIAQHLSWQGFIKLSRGTVASPTATIEDVTKLLDLLELSVRPAIATAEFVDLDQLVRDDFFADGFDIPDMEAAYRQFVSDYEPLGDAAVAGTSLQAFAVRTMLVHDLRRIRLRFPDVPAALLPDNWIGNQADELASELYCQLSAGAAEVLAEIFEQPYPEVMLGRFAR